MMMSATEVRQIFGAGNAAADSVTAILDKSGLPQALKERLMRDALGGGESYQRIPSTEHLEVLTPNSSWIGTVCSGCTCRNSTLIIAGRVGKMRDQDDFFFLGPGFHAYGSCGQEMLGDEDVSVVNKAVVNGPRGFVTVSEGRCGVLMVGAEFRLLPPGTYQWNSPSVLFVQSVDITRNDARLGPYSLITVPDGDVAVTFNNGNLVILGHDTQPNSPQAPASRTYFLDDPKWVLCCFLSLKEQTDRLEGNDLLSKDNVELLMVAWSHWRIVDPVLAVSRCATTMDDIRTKVDALVRAAIARIVAGTNIGSGPVSGGLSRPLMVARETKGDSADEPNLSHLMQSDQATRHMSELSAHLSVMGVEVVGVYVPEKRMKNDDIRQEVAKQAVIGIKAEAERSAADAQAYATVTAAKAQAEAIAELARAHAEAGARLGEASGTAARLALTEAMTKTLERSTVTIFSGGPSQMSYLLSGPTA